MDNDELSSSQTEKVLQFQDLTGIEDINICRDVLIRHQWDLEVAIQEQLNIREGRPSMYVAATTDTRVPQVINDRFLQHVFSSNPAGPPPSGLTGYINYVFNYFLNLCWSTFSTLISTLMGIFTGNERIVTDPLGDVMNFIQTYTIKYPSHPVLYQGTYAQALNDAKRELKFLIVYLHSESNTDVTTFCRDTLSNSDVIEYINRNNMLFWGCDVQSPEGYRVSHSINARAYPIMVVVGLRANKMVIMGRNEGFCTAAELVQRLQTIVQDNDVWLSQARADRLERSFTQSLRQQQDEAYEISLRADQEKERLRQLERDTIRQRELEQEAEKMAEVQRKEDIARQKINMASNVPSEPDVKNPDTINVLFKLPNGSRIERRFLGTDSLEDIYNFVFCHPSSPDSFEITTNFPKRVLIAKEPHGRLTSLFDVGLSTREVLFVNDLDA